MQTSWGLGINGQRGKRRKCRWRGRGCDQLSLSIPIVLDYSFTTPPRQPKTQHCSSIIFDLWWSFFPTGFQIINDYQNQWNQSFAVASLSFTVFSHKPSSLNQEPTSPHLPLGWVWHLDESALVCSLEEQENGFRKKTQPDAFRAVSCSVKPNQFNWCSQVWPSCGNIPKFPQPNKSQLENWIQDNWNTERHWDDSKRISGKVSRVSPGRL